MVNHYYYQNEKMIRVYHTHITISPYKLGENERIERYLSIWVDAEFRFDPIGYMYDEKERTLYVPRGVNLAMLQAEFNSVPLIVKSHTAPKKFKNVKMLVPPKSMIQMEAIDFLSGRGEFYQAQRYSQQALILDTGDGKTYTTVYAIVNFKMVACIITHQDAIKNQWINTFKNMTNIPLSSLVNINGSPNMLDVINGGLSGNIYFVNHQTINSFAKTYGWHMVSLFFEKAGIGIKVFDEAHKNFKNVLHTDFFSDVYKTFYLTANFGRTDTKEEILYRKAFSRVLKYGEQTRNYKEKRKHIIYVPVLYHSNPSTTDLISVMNAYGFSVLNFSKYAIYDDIEKTQLNKFKYVFELANKLDGKILVTIPKIDDTEYMVQFIKKEYPDLGKSIGTINSRNSKDINHSVKENCDIIISTIKSCGTGVDIKGLRCVINLEPFSSRITANQLSGRLREYAPDKDTYFFDLIDLAFPSCEKQYKSKLTDLRKKCKEIQQLKL